MENRLGEVEKCILKEIQLQIYIYMYTNYKFKKIDKKDDKQLPWIDMYVD